MKKLIYSMLSAIIVMVLSACSESSPWVGEWYPSNDVHGNSIVKINSNGTVDMITDADDGYIKISGTWTDSDGILITIFDSNTIEIDLDNPIMKEITKQALIEFAGEKWEMLLSEDGNALISKNNNQKSFVRKQ